MFGRLKAEKQKIEEYVEIVREFQSLYPITIGGQPFYFDRAPYKNIREEARAFLSHTRAAKTLEGVINTKIAEATAPKKKK